MKSMTGYGTSVFEKDNSLIKTEIKSLNSKFFEFKLRIPNMYQEKEIELRNHIEKKLIRGKIDLNILINRADLKEIKKNINTDLFKAYYKEISELSKELDLSKEHIMGTLLKFPDILMSSNINDKFDEKEWKLILKSVDSAIAEFDRFRINEGEKLGKEILKYLEIIANYGNEISQLRDERLKVIDKRIRAKINEFDNMDIDKDRFEQEMIYYMEKLDITEELDRLDTHIEYFKKTMSEKNSGKKLNFISQEIGREVNTLGSKANNSVIQHKVVLMKNELEKIKQQLANIL